MRLKQESLPARCSQLLHHGAKIGAKFMVTAGLLCASVAMAQVGQTINGLVTDSSGAALPGTTIVVHNEKTGVDTTVVSSASGSYTVPYLPPGLYDVTATRSGFAGQSRKGFLLSTDRSVSANFAMKVGSVKQTVVVSASQLSLDTTNADVSYTISNRDIKALPTDGSNVVTLLALTPGVTWNQGYGEIEPYNTGFYGVNINHGAMDINLDGVSDMDWGFQAPEYIPPVEAVQEFTTTTMQYDASYGHGESGSMDITTDSGSNDLHGTIYEKARRTWMDANTWQNNFYGTKRGSQKQDLYGIQVSGPIVIPHLYNGHNRSFFIVSWQNAKAASPSPETLTVPDPSWLPKCPNCNADFSNETYWNGTYNEPVIIYDPASIHLNSAGTLVRDPFPGNIIPGSRIDPIAAKIVSYYPAPNVKTPSNQTYWQNNYHVNVKDQDNYHNIFIRWDQVLTQKDRLTLRYGLFQNFNEINYSGLPDSNPAQWGWLPAGIRYNNFGVHYEHIFSDTKLFDIRASATANQNYQINGHSGFNPQTELGFPAYSSPDPGLFVRFPEVSLAGFMELGGQAPFNYVNNSLALLPSFTWVTPKHDIRFGADIRVDQRGVKQNQGGIMINSSESWTQSDWLSSTPPTGPLYSGNSVASFLLGDLTGGSATIPAINYFSDHYDALWIEDDYRPLPNLMLNLGLRYDMIGAAADRYNRMNSVFDPSIVNPVSVQTGQAVVGGVTFAGVGGQPRNLPVRYWGMIQPRFGFALQVTHKIVLMGGAGKTYSSACIYCTAGQVGFTSVTQVVASQDSNRTPYAKIDNPFPSGLVPVTGDTLGPLTGLGQSFNWTYPHAKWPANYFYSFGMQQQLSSHDILEMLYLGNDTIGLWEPYNLNTLPLSVEESCNVDIVGSKAQSNCNPSYDGYVANPFYNVSAFQGTALYSEQKINPLTLKYPFPAFGTLTENGKLNNGRGWLNSLQVSLTHRWANSLSGQVAWVWSKTMDSGGYLRQPYNVVYRSIDPNDIAHRITAYGTWSLPVGRGRMLLGHANRLVDTAVGGWSLSGTYIFESGRPWMIPGGSSLVHSAWVPRKNIMLGNLHAIRGVSPCMAVEDQQDASLQAGIAAYADGCKSYNIIQKAPYTVPQNIVYSGIRNGWNNQINMSLSKTYQLVGRVTMSTTLDAYNVLNHPEWTTNYGSGNDADFGLIVKGPSNQSNPPRQMQLSASLNW